MLMFRRSPALRGLFAAFLLLLSGAQILMAQPKRRAIIEKYTGAWCQYCPGGAATFDQLSQKYSEEELVLVAVHNRDGMALTEESQFDPYKNGYPSGVVNRINFGSTPISLSPSNWDGAVAQVIQQNAAADVMLKNVSFNSGTRRVTLDLEAKFFANVSGPVRVNLYVIEDSVSGSGSQFDQVNAFNTLEGHPFYGKGNPIKNYQHRHVLRQMVDGAWGATGVVPDNPKAGAVYKKSYSFTMNASWKPERITLVGMVQKFATDVNSREILNVVQESLTIRATRATLTMAESPYLKVAPAGKATYKVTVTNENQSTLDFNFAINDSKSVLPADWKATVEPATVNLEKGASADLTVTIEAPKAISQAELATIVLDATPADMEGTIPRTTSATVYALPTTAKNAIIAGQNLFNYVEFYNNALSGNEYFGAGLVTLPNTPALLDAYKDQLQVYIYTLLGGALINGQIYTGFPLGTTGDAATTAGTITQLLAAGKRVYVSAPQALWWAFDKSTTTAQGKNPEVVSFFNNLKLELLKTEQRYTLNGNTVSLKQYPIKGIDNDSIGDQFNATANLSFDSYTFYTDIIKLGAGSPCKPILYSDNSQSNIVGVRYQNETGGRLVFVTSPIESYDNPITRQTFLEKSLNWLAGDLIVVAPKPRLTLNSDIQFGAVELKASKTMETEISNSGQGELIISSLQITGSKASAFKLVDAPAMPIKIAAGGKVMLKISFTPDTKQNYLASLDFTSNDGGVEGSTAGIDLVGEGTETAPDKPAFTGVASLDYGTVAAATDKTLSLTNGSGDIVTVNTVEFTGTDKDAFKASFTNPVAVPNGQKFQTKITFTPSHNGLHTATAKITSKKANGKDDIYTVELTATAAATGVKEDAVLTSSMAIMPNPATVDAHVSFTVAERSNLNITVADMTGAVVFSLNNQAFDPGTHAVNIPVSALAAGAYTVTVRNQNGATTTLPLRIVR